MQLWMVSLVIIAATTSTVLAADSKRCNGKYDRGESPDMGPDMMPFWILMNAAVFRHCGFAPLNYQPYFDRMLKATVCPAESASVKTLNRANEEIINSLKKFTDEQFVKEAFIQRDGSLSYGMKTTKEQFCKQHFVSYKSFKSCLDDEADCERETKNSPTSEYNKIE